MQRRTYLKQVGFVLAGLTISPALATAMSNAPLHFEATNDSTLALLDELAETILPTTATPGAKAAQVGGFIHTVMQDCYDEPSRTQFYKDLTDFAAFCRKAYKNDFIQLPESQRIAALQQATVLQPTFFKTLKELTLFGYFTSEIGCTQALRYNPIPGKFEGCLPLQPTDKADASYF